MDATMIILGIILIILVYILYRYITADKELLQKYLYLGDGNLQPIDNLDKPDSTRYGYGFWIYVNTWDATTTKEIFSVKNETNGTMNIRAILDKDTASMVVEIANTSGSQNIQVTDNFPLQKWVHVVISVDNNYVDNYIDGKLVRSSKVDNVAKPEINNKIHIGGSGFDAYMSKFKRFAYPINPQKAYDEYMDGNGQSNLGIPMYGIDLTILKDNEIYKQVNVL